MGVPHGLVFVGPHGCGKSLIARCIANQLGATLLTVVKEDILSSYLGQSEQNLRNVFQTGRNHAPCVIYFKAIDHLVINRDDIEDADESSKVYNRLLSTLLNELDGMNQSHESVVVIASASRLASLDAALLRPGKHRYVQLWLEVMRTLHYRTARSPC